ncbi:MAG TPA: DNA translocase FtsK 4TM domain-containing protein, partial [Longimicrobium sp.]|nr:DNA translocase FtsK 4TM domain-containing protein [Longimicrobium sp.]
MVFLALALASYHQTDPSASTAAAEGRVANWMGPIGAAAADRLLFLFGPAAILLLPLLYVHAVRLWRLAEGAPDQPRPRWWRQGLKLLAAIVLLGTVLALVFETPVLTLPASMGGLAGLLGAHGVRATAALLPPE